MSDTRYGFACLWSTPPEPTWSHIPWQLLTAMRAQARVVDLGPRPGRVVDRGLHLAGARRDPVAGNVSLWHNIALTDRWLHRRVDAALRGQHVDSLLLVRDMMRVDVPTAVYRDVVFDHLADVLDSGVPFHMVGHPGFSRRHYERRRARDNRLLAELEAVVVFSRWSADHLIGRVGVDASCVHVVAPGSTAIGPCRESDLDARRLRRRSRLLFVGSDFRRKGGCEVLDALAYVRAERPEVTLTIIGPADWPLSDPPPEGVDFRGACPPHEVASAYRSHDLFVMPSRFEPYGISFVEALGHGVPCVARDACAMPEILGDGRFGRLVSDDDPRSLADHIVDALDDDDLYDRVAARVPEQRAHATWARAAGEMLAILEGIARN